MKKTMNVMAKVFAVLGVATLIWTFVSLIRLIVAGNLTIEMLQYPLVALIVLPALPFGWSLALSWAEKEVEREEAES